MLVVFIIVLILLFLYIYYYACSIYYSTNAAVFGNKVQHRHAISRLIAGYKPLKILAERRLLAG